MLNIDTPLKDKNKFRRYAFILLAILVVIALGYWSINFFMHSDNDTTPSSPPTTSSPTSSTNTNSGASKTDSSVAPSLDTSVTPAVPSGTFVSNHHPNLDGKPAPNTLVSTCTSTPGATCTIHFTKGSTDISLPSHALDAAGNTSWEWALEDIGLTTGEWSITAAAVNGDKTSSSVDSLTLVIGE